MRPPPREEGRIIMVVVVVVVVVMCSRKQYSSINSSHVILRNVFTRLTVGANSELDFNA